MNNSGYFKLIRTHFFKAAGSPLTAVKLVWRRPFPFGIRPKDMTAYRIGSWSYGAIKREEVTRVFPGIETCNVYVERAFERDITTSVDLFELMVLCGVIKRNAPSTLLEIGTFNGNTTLNMALNAGPDARVFTVDLPPDWKGKTEINIPKLYINVTDRNSIGSHYLANAEAAKKITQVFTDSAVLDWSSLNSTFDFIFIDGNHHYDYVIKDTQNAMRVLSKEGWIFWHDYGMIEDVSRAVDSFRDQLEIRVISGTRLACGRFKAK